MTLLERTKCGACGSTNLIPADQQPPSSVKQQAVLHAHGRGVAIAALATGSTVLVGGVIFIIVPIDPILTVLGFFMMMLGAVMLLGITGVFRGTPYRSRVLNRADRERRRRERRKYAD